MNQFMTCLRDPHGFAQIILLFNFFYSMFFGPKCGRNPWNANGLEWSAPSPPGHGNFESVPSLLPRTLRVFRPEPLRRFLVANRSTRQAR